MQLTKKERVFDQRKIQEVLTSENKFISDLFAVLSIPTRPEENDDKVEENNAKTPHNFKKETTRATSLTELQDRLHAITSKKKLTYKEKLTKKSLKNRMKKKTKQDLRKAEQKGVRALKAPELTNGVKTAKPVFNSEGKMVFSKFDFSNIGSGKKDKKQEKDPKKLLETLEKQKEKLMELEERGDLTQVVEIKEKTAWKNALAKAEGIKVKDDETLLKKTVQRKEQQKRSSKKKWEKREETVAKAKNDRQEKRTKNIEKRKSDKKKKKMKKAVKKGKVIPGF